MRYGLTDMKYQNPDYLKALRFLTEDDRVETVGLCNFDTKHLLEVVQSGIRVYTNQVQVRHSHRLNNERIKW